MATKRDDIGLLVVHGIGEQKQLYHLRETAKELASLVAESPEVVRLSVIDDSDSADNPRIIIAATVRKGRARRQLAFHLHEVWWADLGMKRGVLAQIRFWLWGLGQWGAEAVFTGNRTSNSAQMMVLPSFSGQPAPNQQPPGFWRRLPTHLALFGAAFLAFLTFFTWSAAKRLIAFLSKRLPDPDLISLFIGDVMVYQAAGGPGRGTVEDPDLPVRTTIRRRMVRGMTNVAQRYERWMILAHSLGCVPAFNALQEMELTLPNYLTEDEWNALPASLTTQSPFVAKGAKAITHRMMPRRPPWLSEKDAIDRAALFKGFAGLVTYGCPLDKFAAMWPRIVPLNKQTAVFQPGCEWINIHEPTDPVAARLDAFTAPDRDPSEPTGQPLQPLAPQNFACGALPVFLLSHLYYFNPWRRRARSMAAAITGALLSGEPLSASASRAVLTKGQAWLRTLVAVVQVVLLFIILLAAGGYLLLLIRGLFSCTKPVCSVLGDWTLEDLLCNALIVLIADFAIVFIAGIVRMFRDALRPEFHMRKYARRRLVR